MKQAKRQFIRTLAGAAVLAAFASAASAQDTIKIGVLATLEGPFAAGGQDGIRGAELALKEKGGMAGGKKITLLKGSSDATPDKAVNATRKESPGETVGVCAIASSQSPAHERITSSSLRSL